jgi:hypothetical protein
MHSYVKVRHRPLLLENSAYKYFVAGNILHIGPSRELGIDFFLRSGDCAFVIKPTRHTKTKLHGLSSRANYTDRAAAAGRRS